jgi:hypothetical protein
MQNTFFQRMTVFGAMLAFSSAICASDLSEEAMLIKASELTKLTTAVESAVRYEQDQSTNLGESDLLKFATSNDPALLGRFADLTVRVLRSDDLHAAVLICTGDGSKALLEDAGCTAAMDRQAWREIPEAGCEFKLDLTALCTVSQTTATSIAPSRDFETPLIEIADVVWTQDVNKETRQPVAVISKANPGKRLVLWMKIKGSEAALNQLASQGKLPIRHKWYRDSIMGSEAEGVKTPTDEIEIPAAKRGVIDKLRNEARAMGYFTWRTWSFKEKTNRGTWKVRVVYADNTPVLCGNASGAQPCEYKIEVR